MKWAVNLLLTAEFHSDAVPDSRQPFVDAMLDRSDVGTSSEWIGAGVAILLGMFFLARTVAVLLLRWKAKAAYE